MTGPRILAAVMAALACFLAIAAVSALSSGAGGMIPMLGALLVVGAVASLLFAVLLFNRSASSAAVKQSVRHTRGQRVVLLVIGVAALAWCGKAIVTGKLDASGTRHDLVRAVNPTHFWQAVSIYLLAGGACLYLGLRRPHGAMPEQRQSGSARRR